MLAGVTMPEATVDEHYLSLLHEHQVRGAGEIRPVQPEPVSEAMRKAPDRQLGHGILAADASHSSRARGRGQIVHHRGNVEHKSRRHTPMGEGDYVRT